MEVDSYIGIFKAIFITILMGRDEVETINEKVCSHVGHNHGIDSRSIVGFGIRT